MSPIDLPEIERLLHEVVRAPSKKAAEADLRRLEFIASGLRGEVAGYTVGKLNQAIICAKAASGQVKDKDHQIHRMRNAWSVFQSDIEHGRQNR